MILQSFVNAGVMKKKTSIHKGEVIRKVIKMYKVGTRGVEPLPAGPQSAALPLSYAPRKPRMLVISSVLETVICCRVFRFLI